MITGLVPKTKRRQYSRLGDSRDTGMWYCKGILMTYGQMMANKSAGLYRCPLPGNCEDPCYPADPPQMGIIPPASGSGVPQNIILTQIQSPTQTQASGQETGIGNQGSPIYYPPGGGNSACNVPWSTSTTGYFCSSPYSPGSSSPSQQSTGGMAPSDNSILSSFAELLAMRGGGGEAPAPSQTSVSVSSDAAPQGDSTLAFIEKNKLYLAGGLALLLGVVLYTNRNKSKKK